MHNLGKIAQTLFYGQDPDNNEQTLLLVMRECAKNSLFYAKMWKFVRAQRRKTEQLF